MSEPRPSSVHSEERAEAARGASPSPAVANAAIYALLPASFDGRFLRLVGAQLATDLLYTPVATAGQ